jgi:hypothetical protein
MLLMIGLLILVMLARLSPGWETVAASVWAALTLAGMAAWVRLNWTALQRTERTERTLTTRGAVRRADMRTRTLPLTPVQAHFLEVTQPIDDKECARHSSLALTEENND